MKSSKLNKNFLITGANSIIGQDISNKLLKSNFKIWGTFNKKPPKIKHKNLKLIKFNLEKKIKFSEVIYGLIHVSSMTPNSFNKRKNYNQINFSGFKKLLKNKFISNCNLIILISTMSIYGKIEVSSIKENYKKSKLDNYGRSKLKMEEYLEEFSKKKKIRFVILRLPGVIGGGMVNNLNFLSRLMNQMYKNKKVNIQNEEDYFNNVIYSKTLANIVLNVIINNKIKGAFNLGAKKPVKLINIVKFLIKKIGSKSRFQLTKSSKKSFTIDINKILKYGIKLDTVKQSLSKSLKDYA